MSVYNSNGDIIDKSNLPVGEYTIISTPYRSNADASQGQYILNFDVVSDTCNLEASDLKMMINGTIIKCVVKDYSNGFIIINNSDYANFKGDATSNDLIKTVLYGNSAPVVYSDFGGQIYVDSASNNAYTSVSAISKVWKKITP